MNYEKIMRSIIKTASEWNQFHLSDDEYEARATVQKQEVLGILDLWEEKESKEREQAREKAREKAELEKKAQKEIDLIKQLQLLLLTYDSISGKSENPQNERYNT